MIGTKDLDVWGMPCRVQVAVPDRLAAALAVVGDELDAVDRACSRFRTDSELAAVCAAAGRPVPVSPLFVTYLDAALWAAEMTAGHLDPTVGGCLVGLGYDRDFRDIHGSPTGRIKVVSAPGYQSVGLDREAGTVSVRPGSTLDLGATAKALAADRAASRAAQRTGVGVLVSLGGDLAVAGTAPPGGWLVHVTDDARASDKAPGQTVAITVGGLATSSTATRSWQRGGKRLHHLIDPSTGAPAASPFRTVSVAAASCLEANTASTAALLLGRRAVTWLDGLGLPARLVAHDGTVTRLGAWPQPRPVVAAGRGLGNGARRAGSRAGRPGEQRPAASRESERRAGGGGWGAA